MELDKIKEFVEFTQSMNFTTAARTLHMSQPALSKHGQRVDPGRSTVSRARGLVD